MIHTNSLAVMTNSILPHKNYMNSEHIDGCQSNISYWCSGTDRGIQHLWCSSIFPTSCYPQTCVTSSPWLYIGREEETPMSRGWHFQQMSTRTWDPRHCVNKLRSGYSQVCQHLCEWLRRNLSSSLSLTRTANWSICLPYSCLVSYVKSGTQLMYS